MYTILVASLNENMKLAKRLQEELKSMGKESELINLIDLALPLYNSDKEEKDGIPTAITSLNKTLEASKGYIVVAPEYNYSIPPSLTNAIAWISRVGDDFRVLFNEKPILLATHSGGGGNDVLNAMRTQFTKLGAMVMPRQILTTYQIALEQSSAQKSLKQLIKHS